MRKMFAERKETEVSMNSSEENGETGYLARQ